MLVFVTGATGFIGSSVVKELINAGHRVVGMTRSQAGAEALRAAGAEVHHGELEDLESLRKGAAQSDGVIHTAFDHEFANYAANCQKDRRAIEALGAGLAGTNRPLLITSGTSMGTSKSGELALETQPVNPHNPVPRIASELAGEALLQTGINLSVVRLPQVHDAFKQGLITPLVAVAREKGISAYVGVGRSRFPAAHVLDVARLYRLALEKAEAGARYHAVAEEGVPLRDIAEVLGRGLNLPLKSLRPEEAAQHFGWLSLFVDRDMPASSARTQEILGWNPTGPGLLEDLEQMRF